MAILKYKCKIHKVIFFHIGWMKKYQGNKEPILGNHGFIQNNKGTPGEMFNFYNVDGKVYGYVPNTGRSEDKERKEGEFKFKEIDLTKLGADEKENQIEDVTVVFFAPRPADIPPYHEEPCIVGWYKHATLFKKPEPNDYLISKGFKIGVVEPIYYATTNIINAVCLPIEKRNFVINSRHKMSGGYGQSSVWYADKVENKQALDQYVKDVLDYIYEDKQPLNQKDTNSNCQWNSNVEERLKIESIAVETTQAYFEANHYHVTSVEKEAKGWDLECKLDQTTWFVEVKGTKGQQINFELTPNE